jgi:hypothetical protein
LALQLYSVLSAGSATKSECRREIIKDIMFLTSTRIRYSLTQFFASISLSRL